MGVRKNTKETTTTMNTAKIATTTVTTIILRIVNNALTSFVDTLTEKPQADHKLASKTKDGVDYDRISMKDVDAEKDLKSNGDDGKSSHDVDV